MSAYRSTDRNRMPSQQQSSSDGSRHLLAVRAPDIGLNSLAKGDWMILDRRSSDAQISVLFERAKAFLGDRGEAIVAAQRIVGRDVDTRFTHKHRASKIIDVREFRQLSESDRQIFWSCVDKHLRDQAASVRQVAIKAHDAKMAKQKQVKEAARKERWRPILRGVAWTGGLLAVAFVLTFPPTVGAIAFIYEAYAMKYGW